MPSSSELMYQQQQYYYDRGTLDQQPSPEEFLMTQQPRYPERRRSQEERRYYYQAEEEDYRSFTNHQQQYSDIPRQQQSFDEMEPRYRARQYIDNAPTTRSAEFPSRQQQKHHVERYSDIPRRQEKQPPSYENEPRSRQYTDNATLRSAEFQSQEYSNDPRPFDNEPRYRTRQYDNAPTTSAEEFRQSSYNDEIQDSFETAPRSAEEFQSNDNPQQEQHVEQQYPDDPRRQQSSYDESRHRTRQYYATPTTALRSAEFRQSYDNYGIQDDAPTSAEFQSNEQYSIGSFKMQSAELQQHVVEQQYYDDPRRQQSSYDDELRFRTRQYNNNAPTLRSAEFRQSDDDHVIHAPAEFQSNEQYSKFQSNNQHQYPSSSFKMQSEEFPSLRSAELQQSDVPEENEDDDFVTACPRLNLEWMWRLHERHLAETSRKAFLSGGKSVLKRRGLQQEMALQEQLRKQYQFPNGLARTLVQHSDSCPLRIWLVDNSGSMHKDDGHMVVVTDNYKIRNVNCTRWEEVCATLLWHAKLAVSLETPTAIRFINDPYVGPQQVGVAASSSKTTAGVERLQTLLHRIRPGGTSAPLIAHLKEIVADITKVAPLLKEAQKWITLVLVTDGMPCDDRGRSGTQVTLEFIETLKLLRGLNVWIVIRLSTDEKEVVEFYQNLDHCITRQDDDEDNNNSCLHLDVLDDYTSEAELVHEQNPWLAYGYPLHLCREAGVHASALDVMNDRPLQPQELRDLICVLFDRNNNSDSQQDLTIKNNHSCNDSVAQHRNNALPCEQPFLLTIPTDEPLPDPRTHYKEFRSKIEPLILHRTGKIWNPLKQTRTPWMDLREMDKMYLSFKNNNQRDYNNPHRVETKCACVIL